jgi:hypothetical protein
MKIMPPVCTSVYMYVCVYVLYVRIHTDVLPNGSWMADGFFSYSLFKNLFTVGRLPVNTNILAPKIGIFHMGPKELNYRFLDYGSNNFDWISMSYGYRRPKENCMGGTSEN